MSDENKAALDALEWAELMIEKMWDHLSVVSPDSNATEDIGAALELFQDVKLATLRAALTRPEPRVVETDMLIYEELPAIREALRAGDVLLRLRCGR